jgi:hypothetical protein
VQAELDALSDRGPTPAELARVKKAARAELLGSLQSNAGLASSLATYEVRIILCSRARACGRAAAKATAACAGRCGTPGRLPARVSPQLDASIPCEPVLRFVSAPECFPTSI